ncbi:MAG: tetratricopeptide repeat protein [Phycisphaerales bacterium]|nr:tetratricopeptide repeat protein [Phycisphaerales bacterium]
MPVVRESYRTCDVGRPDGAVMSDPKKQYKVFIASPGDLDAERRAFKEVIDEMNDGFAEAADASLEPLAWELSYSVVGRPPQDVFNDMVDQCDCFILALHRRWGQDAPDSEYSSYTEEEFHRALNRFNKTGKPRIFVFLKKIDTEFMVDPGEQLKHVLAFRKELEKSNNVIYKEFEDENGFRLLLRIHLKALIKDELPSVLHKREAVVLPVETIARLEKAEAENKRMLAEVEEARKQIKEETEAVQKKLDAKALEHEKQTLQHARLAAKAALDCRVEEARQSFAVVTQATNNLSVLYLCYEFYKRIGELDEAEEILNRWLSISGPDQESAEAAAAYCNLGLVCRTRGDLDRSEEMHRKSLAIEEKLGRQEGVARDYGNLGLIYQTRGDLDRAEKMFRKALVINEELGRKEGMANQYGNLGLIYRTRGDLDRAEEMHRRSLAIEEKLGRQEGMASEYGNLGLIYKTRGDLVCAEQMHRRALEINEKLGRPEGMAIQYGNLGVIYRKRGGPEEARRLWTKARELFERIGMKPEVKKIDKLIKELEEKKS